MVLRNKARAETPETQFKKTKDVIMRNMEKLEKSFKPKTEEFKSKQERQGNLCESRDLDDIFARPNNLLLKNNNSVARSCKNLNTIMKLEKKFIHFDDLIKISINLARKKLGKKDLLDYTWLDLPLGYQYFKPEEKDLVGGKIGNKSFKHNRS